MRYNGGKANFTNGIVRTIRELMPKNGIFWSPFCGSAKVECRVRNCRRYCSDLDRHIILMLKAVQNGWVPPKQVTEATYEQWKKRKHWHHPMVAFVGYGCSFSGKFFGGYIREGHGLLEGVGRSIERQRDFLRHIDFRCQSYQKGLWTGETPDLIYCDPPYSNTTTVGSKTSFNSQEFWSWAAEQSKRSIVLISEYECPVPGAACLWTKTRRKLLRSKDGIATKTERLFCLDPSIARRVGFGYV